MGMTLNNNGAGTTVTQQPNIPGTRNTTEWKKSEYLFKYVHKTEGMTSPEINIQLPMLCGVDNLKLQPDFNTGTEINEKIKRENELVQLIIDTAKQMKEKNKRAAEIELPDIPGIYVYIWKYEEKKNPTYEESKNNFFHRAEPVIRFID